MSLDANEPGPRAFGTGWISGTLSVVLAAIGLGAVLCFHFPAHLTIPDVRPHYPEAVIRGLLHVVLVTAFLLGYTSVMLRQNKTLGLVGMAIVLVAALLGGSQVPIDGEMNSDVYLGLDYVLLILILYSAIFVPLEKLFGRLQQDVFRKGWRVDLTYFFVSTLLVQLTTYLTLQPAIVLFGWATFPEVQSFIRSQPYWLQFLEIMLLADLVQYWVHRMFHEIPWLWKFHAVHHSAEVMDWMAGNRLHLVDLAITRSLIYVPSFILGFDDAPMVAYIVFVSLHSVFIHSNLRFKFGPLRWVFATPQFHHWHHTAEAEGIDKNYAVHLPVLDLIFGTFHLPGARWPTIYGVRNNDVPESYLAQWVYPFRRKKPVETDSGDSE
ncbi:Fatty acid hydroxylase superfamily protein [Planctomycetes bacterium MalM25]|nr:Fatty acid hydroxylase superfamily protein [Planctomycetes bacterium MalM25]